MSSISRPFFMCKVIFGLEVKPNLSDEIRGTHIVRAAKRREEGAQGVHIGPVQMNFAVHRH